MDSSTPSEAVDSVEHGMHDIALSDVALDPAVSSTDAHNHDSQSHAHQDTSYYGDRDGWNERRDSDPRVDDDRGLNSNAEQSSWQDNHRAEDTFEAVELDADSSIQNGYARRPVSDEHSRSSSPADDATTTPPLSPSLASTAPTTIASSSNDGPLPPTAAAAAGEPVPGPSTPPEKKPAPPAATAAAAAAAQPKVGATPDFFPTREQGLTACCTPQPTPQKKPSKSRTVMQQVVSFTRQRNLPPKSREEEVRWSLY